MELKTHDLVSFHKDDSVLYGEIIVVQEDVVLIQAGTKLYKVPYEDLIHKY